MKKILSLVLTCSLVLGSFGMAFAAPADVEGTKYEDSVTRLSALEVLKGYEDNTFKPEKTITRAEFAKIMANVTGVGTAAQYAKGQTKFADVAAEHWAAGYINVVSDMGIINGYGDGNFGAEDQVTYAQAITMIVRALGYTPKANAMGGYPGGYLAVAAEKEITDDVSVVSSLAATRGDVAIMVDNSLTVDLMEQITYGQYPEYKEVEDKNLMTTKLDVDELEGRVIAIPDTDSSLDDDEIILAIEDKDDETLTMKIDVDYLNLLGLEVKVWADSSDVFFMDVETDDKDVIFDTVSKVDANEIELLVDDEAYDFDKDVEVYVNYEDAKVKDISKDMYGYVVLNKKDDVVAVNLFDFGTEGALVTEVDGDDISLDKLADLDLADYDDGVYVFDKNFKKVDADEIAEDSVINYFTDGDEAWIVVVNETVSGTLNRASSSEIKVASTEYDVRSNMRISLDNKEDLTSYASDAENLEDLMDEEVTVVLDINGDAKLIYGDVKETSGTMFALYQKGEYGFDTRVKVLNTAGETVTYEFEDDDDFVKADFDALAKNELIAFELNKDGEIAEGTLLHDAELENDDYDIIPNGSFKIDDDGYIEKASKRYYVEDDTILFNVEGGDGEELTFADIEDVDVSLSTNYVIKESKGSDLVAVVFVDAGVAAKATNYAVVVKEPEFDGDWKVTLDVSGEGEVEYAIDGTVNSARKAEYTEGHVLSFRLNTSNEIATETVENPSSIPVINEVNEEHFRFGASTWLKVSDDAVIYLLDEDGDIDKSLSYDDLEKDDKVIYLVDDEKIVALTVITDPTIPTGGDEVTDGTIAFLNADGNAISSISTNHGEAKDITVKFKNTGTSSVVIPGAGGATAKILDADGNTEVVAVNLNGANEVTVLAGRTVTFVNKIAVPNSLDAAEYTAHVQIHDGAIAIVDFETTLDITVVESNDATLTDLAYSGSTVTDFDADTTHYVVQLPSSESGNKTVTATKNSTYAATPVITEATDVEGTTAERTATVKVTAEDGTVKTYTVEFVVNTVPVVNAPIADITKLAADGNVEVDLDGVFTDAETSDLTYTVSKGTDTNSAITSVIVNDGKVIIVPEGTNTTAVGEVEITVTATDEAGESVTDTFIITLN